jgi:hypothetical protein
MKITIVKGSADKYAKAVSKTLEPYVAVHPKARIVIHRPPERLIQVQITDPEFDSLQVSKRGPDVWHMHKQLPEETTGQIGSLILLTPDEAREWPKPEASKKRRSTSV